MATQEEISQIAEQVEGLLKNKGKNISTAEVVESISNLTTIPVVDRNGNVVRVTLDAIRADSEIQAVTFGELDGLNNPFINPGIYNYSNLQIGLSGFMTRNDDVSGGSSIAITPNYFMVLECRSSCSTGTSPSGYETIYWKTRNGRING